MSWTTAYRLALHLLPAGLRRKHAPAMEELFARELQRAHERGRMRGAIAAATGLWDVVRRGAYERVRPAHRTAGERHLHRSHETSSFEAYAPPPGDPHMPRPTTRQLVLRHAASFAVAFAVLTTALLVLFAANQLPALSARGASAGDMVEALLLAVPFTAALTLPMAVLVAVLHEFTRLGAHGTLGAARRERHGVRRLVLPVLAAAAGIAALALVVTAEIVPRANERLATVLERQPVNGKSDREMTIPELREAARTVRTTSAPSAPARAAAYELEVQKKLALSAACIVLALAGMAVAFRVQRGGRALVIGASGALFGTYYVLLVAGEVLADRMVVSPVVAMWGANALLLAAALLAVYTARPEGRGAVVA